MTKKAVLVLILVLFFQLHTTHSFAEESGFTQEDRERLVRVEATLKVFMEQIDKRFAELLENMNNRFEQVDKKFEQMMTFFMDSCGYIYPPYWSSDRICLLTGTEKPLSARRGMRRQRWLKRKADLRNL